MLHNFLNWQIFLLWQDSSLSYWWSPSIRLSVEMVTLRHKLPTKSKHKKEAHRGWNQGWITWEEYRDIVQSSRVVVKKAKAQMELNLLMDVEDNKKDFCKYVGDKKKWHVENGGPLLNQRVWSHRVWLKYWKPSLLQSLLARLCFGNPRSQRPAEQPGQGRWYPWWKRIRLRNS